MPSRLPFTPLDQNCEWIGSRYTLPEKVRDGDTLIQPQVTADVEITLDGDDPPDDDSIR
jgi:hypothetical protein